MKIIDGIFALIGGELVAFVAGDILKGFGITGFFQILALWLAFPLLAVFFLWLAWLIGKKNLFVFQAAKHVLVGAFATVIDLKFFEFLFWILSISIVAKSLSFITATSIKYFGNKYWTFQSPGKEAIHTEIITLLAVDVVGLLINVSFFYYFNHILGPQFGVSPTLWTKLSVIFAALTSAVSNFLGYKFLVFKK